MIAIVAAREPAVVVREADRALRSAAREVLAFDAAVAEERELRSARRPLRGEADRAGDARRNGRREADERHVAGPPRGLSVCGPLAVHPHAIGAIRRRSAVDLERVAGLGAFAGRP